MARFDDWTDRKLTRQMWRYNRRYWNGSIKDYRIRFSPDTKPARRLYRGKLGVCFRHIRMLVVVRSHHRTEEDLRATILHEMVHATTCGIHGRDFYREIKRIRKLGAPLSVWDCLFQVRTVHKPIWLTSRS